MFRTATRRAASALRTTTTHQHAHAHAHAQHHSRHPLTTLTACKSTPLRPSPLLKPNSLPTTTTTTTTRQLTYAQRIKQGYQASRKDIWRRNPIALPFAILSIITATGLFSYIAYIEVTENTPKYSRYPAPVAERLRTAVYYTELNLNPAKAAKAYQEAQALALELGMHPYCEEVLGIRVQTAMMLEMAGLVPASIQVLESTLQGALSYVAEARERSTEGQGVMQTKEAEEREETRRVYMVLRKVVGISIKLAELYQGDHVQDAKKAELMQMFAVQVCLKEMNRRHSLGLPVGGGQDDTWMNLGEIATALTELGHTYTSQGKSELARPLFLRALDLVRADEGENPSRKQVTLLSDIAACVADQAMSPRPLEDPGVSREDAIEAARKWAGKAIEAFRGLDNLDDAGDAEGKMSYCSALMTLGELARFQNKPEEAIAHFTEAKKVVDGDLDADWVGEALTKALDELENVKQ
ncbi:hypothetical protein BO71DRAFT_386507 [Aspergillus ellipticus CBS 707.79]|uniref:Uncharacterized protein n=1 Tax=Aspergillus ellipticus CBS 707.79 TaxID=1448320 RepID=A0A319D093_9EURO|nr:hypothetical protein BO71DRAFT_386507 [Aspergillus ellipticus CBS 707.79]